MSTQTPLSKTSDYELMERLAEHYEKRNLDTDSKNIAHENKLVGDMKRRVATVIETATSSLPDPGTAFNEALFILTSPAVVTYYVEQFGLAPGASLKKLAWGVARRKSVREAGLAGATQKRNDPLYGTRSRSIEADAEDGYTLAGPTLDTRTLEEVEADERSRIHALREAFTQVSAGVLTEQQRRVVLTYANLHVDSALPEMNTQEAVAKTLRITQPAVAQHIRAAQANAAQYPVLSIAIRELCGDAAAVSNETELLMATA